MSHYNMHFMLYMLCGSIRNPARFEAGRLLRDGKKLATSFKAARPGPF